MVSAQDALRFDAKGAYVPRYHRAAGVAGEQRIEICNSPRQVRREWLILEAEESVPFVSYAWAEAWYATVAAAQDHEPVIVVGYDTDGEPGFILPFVLEKRGPFSVLLWPGGTHCAYQCGLFSQSCRDRIREDGVEQFWNEVFASLPKVDAIAAYGIPGLATERDNPLRALPSVDASCVGYRFELSEDWMALYQAKCSSRLRSDDRRCERRFKEMGDVRFVVAETDYERLRLVETLLAQKSVQLQDMGAPDFTSGKGVREFYRRLVTSQHWGAGSQVFLSSLEINGDPAAINLGIIKNGEFHGLVLSMAEGETARFGPGRQLLKRTIEYFCGRGLDTFDMGAGDESNKLKWADRSVSRRDVLVPLTLRGQIFVHGMRAFFAAKTSIKHSPAVWQLFSRYRKHLGC